MLKRKMTLVVGILFLVFNSCMLLNNDEDIDGVGVLHPTTGDTAVYADFTVEWYDDFFETDSYVDISLYTKSNVLVKKNFTVYNDGSYIFSLDSSEFFHAGGPGLYYLVLQGSTSYSKKDTSGLFALTNLNGALTITAPVAGAIVLPGNATTVTWNKTGTTGSSVNIFLMNESTIISSWYELNNSGSFTTTLPSPLIKADNYRFKIASYKWNAINDLSDTFTIQGTDPDSIGYFTSPVAGGVFSAGSTYTLSWTGHTPTDSGAYDLLGTYVNLALFSDTILVDSIATYAFNQGLYEWNIPYGIETGIRYRVKVS